MTATNVGVGERAAEESMMEITEISVTLRDEDKLKAFVNVTFDSVFVVRGMKIINGNTGFFVSMPSRRMEDGSYRDIAHPITGEFRSYVEDRIMSEYWKTVIIEKKISVENLPRDVLEKYAGELVQSAKIAD